jgi:PAS domain S-box-containing protein
MKDQALQSTTNSPSHGRSLNQINSLSSAGKELMEIIDQEIKILLIEDNPGDARLIQEHLRSTGTAIFQMEHVQSLREGLNSIAEKSFDVLLLDLGLPDSQGLETFFKVQTQEPKIPILLMTGLDDEDLALDAVRNGAQDYLVKGQVNGDLLTRSIRYAVARKRSEIELMRLKEFNEGIIQSMAEGIVLQDERGIVTFANPAAESILNYPTHELLGKHWTEIIPSDQHDIVNSADSRRKVGESDLYELQLMRGDEGRVVVLVAGSPRFENDRFLGSMAVFTDITERKRIEQAERELAKMKDKFIASVSHELRTPLFTINGFLSLLREGRVSDVDAQREFLGRASYDADRLASLVDDLIDLYLFEGDLVQLNIDEVEINDVISEVTQTMSLLANVKGITLSHEPSSTAPKIKCDRNRMKRVIGNLIENSIKASETRGFVQVSSHETRRSITVEVTDYGPYVPTDEHAGIFDVFSQADDSNKAMRGGSGLGLYVSKLIVEAHAGEIKLESSVGVGNIFSISLPN